MRWWWEVNGLRRDRCLHRREVGDKRPLLAQSAPHKQASFSQTGAENAAANSAKPTGASCCCDPGLQCCSV